MPSHVPSSITGDSPSDSVQLSRCQSKNNEESNMSTPEHDPKLYEAVFRYAANAPKAMQKTGKVYAALHRTKVPEEGFVEAEKNIVSSRSDNSKAGVIGKNNKQYRKSVSPVRNGVKLRNLPSKSGASHLNHRTNKVIMSSPKSSHPSGGNQHAAVKIETSRIPVAGGSASTVSPKLTTSKNEAGVIKKPTRIQKVISRIPSSKPIPPSTPKKAQCYDPFEVKSYMEHQREVRRLKEKKERTVQKREADRKRKCLIELDQKRKVLLSKSKNTINKDQLENKEDQYVSQATRIYRARKAKSPCSSAPMSKIPTLDTQTDVKEPLHKTVKVVRDELPKVPRPWSSAIPRPNTGSKHDLRMDTDAELRTTLLLQEFESIVHRECLNLKLKASQPKSNFTKSSSTATANKAIETGSSLCEDTPLLLPLSARGSWSMSKYNAHEREVAAIAIQAAFRGYRVRKLLRRPEEVPARRISFFRARTSQSETTRRRLPLMSPAFSPVRTSMSDYRPHGSRKSVTAFGLATDFSVYIPPPPPQVTSSFSNRLIPTIAVSDEEDRPLPLTPRTVPSSRSSFGRLSNRFDEPFPKEALKQLLLHSPSASPANSSHRLRSPNANPVYQVGMVEIPQVSDVSYFQQPTFPTMSMVLKEKVRLLQEYQQKTLEGTVKTPLGRPSREQFYDSDSTQHASIVMSSRATLGGRYSTTPPSTDATITDDYIGPNEEAMKLAYNLRKSPKSSDICTTSRSQAQIDTNQVSECDDRQSSSAPETATNSFSSLGDGRDRDGSYVTIRRRRRPELYLNSQRTSLNELKLKLGETKQDLLEHAVAVSLQQFQQHEKQVEKLHLQSSTKATSKMEAKIDQLRQELSTVNQNVQGLAKLTHTSGTNRTSSAGALPPEVTSSLPVPQIPISALNHPDWVTEIMKCREESVKAQVEIRHLHEELARNSFETRHQETVNMATAVVLAVEEAKRHMQTRVSPPQRQVFYVQGVQTTKSLLEDEDEVRATYADEEFLDTSSGFSHLEEDEVEAPPDEFRDIRISTTHTSLITSVSDPPQIKIASEAMKAKSERDDYRNRLYDEKPVENFEEKEAYAADKEYSQVSNFFPINEAEDPEYSFEEVNKIISDAIAGKTSEILTELSKLEEDDLSSRLKTLSKDQQETLFEVQTEEHEVIEESMKIDSIAKTSEIEESAIPDESSVAALSELEVELPILTSVEDLESKPSLILEASERKEIQENLPPKFEESDNEESKTSYSVDEFLETSSVGAVSVDEEEKLEESTSASHEVDLEISLGKDVPESALHDEQLSLPASGREVFSPIKESKDESLTEVEEELFEEELFSEAVEADNSRTSKQLSVDTSKEYQILDHILNSETASFEQVARDQDQLISNVEVEGRCELPIILDEDISEKEELDQRRGILVEMLSDDEEESGEEEGETNLQQATLDMTELAEYQEIHGSPIRPSVRKWRARDRDIVDQVLLGELVDGNRRWTDYRQEEEVIKEALTETVITRALKETLSSLAKVHK